MERGMGNIYFEDKSRGRSEAEKEERESSAVGFLSPAFPPFLPPSLSLTFETENREAVVVLRRESKFHL